LFPDPRSSAFISGKILACPFRRDDGDLGDLGDGSKPRGADSPRFNFSS
jgi:hypothetical protein